MRGKGGGLANRTQLDARGYIEQPEGRSDPEISRIGVSHVRVEDRPGCAKEYRVVDVTDIGVHEARSEIKTCRLCGVVDLANGSGRACQFKIDRQVAQCRFDGRSQSDCRFERPEIRRKIQQGKIQLCPNRCRAETRAFGAADELRGLHHLKIGGHVTDTDPCEGRPGQGDRLRRGQHVVGIVQLDHSGHQLQGVDAHVAERPVIEIGHQKIRQGDGAADSGNRNPQRGQGIGKRQITIGLRRRGRGVDHLGKRHIRGQRLPGAGKPEIGLQHVQHVEQNDVSVCQPVPVTDIKIDAAAQKAGQHRVQDLGVA